MGRKGRKINMKPLLTFTMAITLILALQCKLLSQPVSIAEKKTDELFKKAQHLYYGERNKKREASKLYRRIIKQFPDFDKIDNCYYHYAEGLLQTGQYLRARSAFFELIGKFPKSSFADDAYLRVGHCIMLLGDKDAGMRQFEKLVKKYPRSPLAPVALFCLANHYTINKADKKTALNTYERLIKGYPDSELAKTASSLMVSLKKMSTSDLKKARREKRKWDKRTAKKKEKK